MDHRTGLVEVAAWPGVRSRTSSSAVFCEVFRLLHATDGSRFHRTQDALTPVERLIVENSSGLFTYEDRLEYLLDVAGMEVVTYEQLWWCAEEVIGRGSPVESIQEKMLQFVSDMLEKGVLVGGLKREQDGANISLSTHSRAQVVAEIRKQIASKSEWEATLQMGWLAFEESPLWP
ncbi:hypothetical protein M2168_006248 [Streptomyces sp. CZ24]|uniref:hypothetical protein n=1 Tax=Streptomyces TaxID=1883 RepID=UPI0011C4BC83|nr:MULTISPECIES: hypothetical protein [Streptomyces]MBV1957476.1 hypothetical protein [Streptomyces sp. BV333]MDH6193130.1 hypothetical protein [Streptomyces sp. CZ24]WTC05743.1 hypothetical protein OG794_29770 [Streptomyces albidoflavus]WTC06225.1 hypothetical protein OG794_30725 [Streptomyces albidoflavus]